MKFIGAVEPVLSVVLFAVAVFFIVAVLGPWATATESRRDADRRRGAGRCAVLFDCGDVWRICSAAVQSSPTCPALRVDWPCARKMLR